MGNKFQRIRECEEKARQMPLSRMEEFRDRYRLIMNSMTREEKDNPALLKVQGRLTRVAHGAGLSEGEVMVKIIGFLRAKRTIEKAYGKRRCRRIAHGQTLEGYIKTLDETIEERRGKQERDI